MLENNEWTEKRFECISQAAGIGPKKLARCRARGRVACLYSLQMFLDLCLSCAGTANDVRFQ